MTERKRADRLLVERGWGLVYGGSQLGLMGVVADTVLSADARNVSVVPEGGIVILKGTVHSRAERAMINAIAIGVVGRKNVLDRLEIVR